MFSTWSQHSLKLITYPSLFCLPLMGYNLELTPELHAGDGSLFLGYIIMLTFITFIFAH